MSSGSKLRQLMSEGTVVAPFIYDGLMAGMAKAVGFQAVYHSGGGNAASLGFPDVGLITLTEMTDKIKIIAASTDLPIISDADTGYGNYTNVIRTVREYERAGAAALHIEDQIWPKSCGYLGNKQVISKQEAVSKIKAAVDARKSEKDLIIIARTDALSVHGWEEVEDRVRSFVEVGADMVFVDGLRTREDIIEYRKRLFDLPLLLNNVPLIPLKEIEKIGNFPLIIHPATQLYCWQALEKVMITLKEEGISLYEGEAPPMIKRIASVLGADEYFKLDNYYKDYFQE